MNTINLSNITKPSRKPDAHKGDHGSVAIIGGDDGMMGAVLLAARAALLAGAGRTYASFIGHNPPTVDMQHPEIMMRSPEALQALSQLECLVMGPGLSISEKAAKLLSYWLKQNTTLLLDADALNLIAVQPALAELLAARTTDSIITPHPGEAARLLNTDTKTVQADRAASARQLAAKLKVVCVLKGAETIVTKGDIVFTNITGNAGLASGGTGDILSGIIGSLLAQGLNPLEAAKLGVYVHGLAADNLVGDGIGPIGLTASEVAIEARDILNVLK